MPTKIVVSGVSRKAANGDYKEYDYSSTVDADLTEQQVFDIVMKEIDGNGIYRKASQADDRIQVSYIGVQAPDTTFTFQPRTETGKFKSYADVGRQLWESMGRPSTISTWTTPTKSDFEIFARMQGVNFATGTASRAFKSGINELTSGVRDYFRSQSWKPAKSGNEQRKESLGRVKSPYRDLRNYED